MSPVPENRAAPPRPRRAGHSAAGAVLAAVTLLLLQLGIATYYWIPDGRARVALAPTWDVVGLMLVIAASAFLPPRPTWAQRALTVALSVTVFLTLVVAVGQGFLQRLFGRELVLVLDIVYVQALFKMLHDAEPTALYLLVVAAVVAGLTLSIAGPYVAIRHLRAWVAPRPPRRLALAAGALVYLAVGGALAGVHKPVAAELASQLSLCVNLKDPLAATARTLEAEAAPTRALTLPAAAGDARPLHIFLFVVESYGHAIFADSPAYAAFPGFLRAQADRLAQAGWSVRSSYLRAPVFGGGSWMADASLLCGVTVDNQKRFVSLFESDVRCLPKWLDAAGYRTVWAAPSTELREDRFVRTYAFDASYFKDDFHYAGPRFGWSSMPDQLVLDFVDRHEVRPHRHDPLFVTEVLTSSHTPWSAIPPLVDWERLGDGAVFNAAPITRFDNRLLGGNHYEAGYLTSVEYSLATIASYLERLPADEPTLVIVLGDHQPQQPIASRWKDDRDVPIHLLARDPRLLERFARFGFLPGILPAPPTGAPASHAQLMGELLSALGAR